MIGVDTNLLVRVFVDDPGAPNQVRRAREAVAEAGRVFIPQPVQIELVWVLGRSYGFGKEALLRVLDEIRQNRAFAPEHPEVFQAALGLFRDGGVDFADAVILDICRRRGERFRTFDEKLGRQEGVQVIEQGR